MRRVTRSFTHLLAAGIMAVSAPLLAQSPPAGLLTPFEERRHARFVEQAKSQPIELLFIGDSAVEFWLAEGRPEWNKNYSDLKAANFGVQGADTKSLLWRLQNGELDHFKAKVIVVDALRSAGDASQPASEAETLSGNAALVAEIRKRQPQAKILLLVVPRMASYSLQAALKKQFADLADGASITFLDVTRSFASPDGRFDTSLGSGRGNALSEKGYATLARAIEPTLRELMSEG